MELPPRAGRNTAVSLQRRTRASPESHYRRKLLGRSFTSPYLHELYNEHFDRNTLRRPAKRVITPLSALTIDDLENSLPYTNQYSLSEILDSYWRRNRDVPPEHRQFRVPILDDKAPGKDIARERLRRFGDDFQGLKTSEPDFDV